MIFGAEKDGTAVDAACNHVLWDVWEEVAGLTGHTPNLVRRAR